MPYRYLRDPLFLCCLVLYFINRWALKPLFPHGFWHNSFNDLILIPFWVPIMLWVARRLRLRADDTPPQWYEIVIPLVLWSWLFEVVLPRLPSFRHTIYADPDDVVYYAIGALASAFWWRTWYGEKHPTSEGIEPPSS